METGSTIVGEPGHLVQWAPFDADASQGLAGWQRLHDDYRRLFTQGTGPRPREVF